MLRRGSTVSRTGPTKTASCVGRARAFAQQRAPPSRRIARIGCREGSSTRVAPRGGTHRGLAPPVGRLTSRRVDFQLGALGGGRALDPWDVPYDLQQKLLAKYRELANREKRLKRYRRAAYIYAELIGDVETAAAVLEEGKHFREAAEIYRKHLHKPLLAARTYESGGLFREAVEIYEELELWEEAGDVYGKMEQSSKAPGRVREST